MFAEVLPIGPPLSSAFHYSIPPELEGRLAAGHLVEVSFGPRRTQGLVVALSDEPPEGVAEFKPVAALVDEQPVLTRPQLDLGYYLAHRYLAPLADCLTMMLPPGLAKRGDFEYELSDDKFDPETDLQFRLVQLLERRGPLRGRQIARALPRRNWRPAAERLVGRGVLRRRPVLQPPSVRPRRVRTARLLIPPAAVPAAQFRLRHGPRLADILDYLFGLLPGQPVLPDVLRVMKCTEADLRLLAERGWLEVTAPEPVIAAAYPPDVMQKWIDRHERDQPQAAAAMRALRQAGGARAVALAELPGVPLETIRALDRQDLLRYSVNPPRVVLKLTGAQVATQSRQLRRPSKRAAVLDFLARQSPPVPVSWVAAETGATTAVLRDLAERDLIALGEQEVLRDPLADQVFIPSEAPRLTRDQSDVWESIASAFALSAQGVPVSHPPFLLHGVTGSGKTEIYLRAVAAALEQGRRAIVLVPEIAVTPQTVGRFASRFPGRVAVVHSGLSDGERYDTWRRARTGAVEVVVGARSALFAPLPDIGLIVVDEEHDESYQNDSPHFNAREAAVEYARQLQAVCLLGSATPDLVSYHRAQRGDYRLLELPQRIMAHGEYIAAEAERLRLRPRYRPLSPDDAAAQFIDLPEVTVVDMRQELRAGNLSMFSRALHAALAEALERREQAILFLNRRGASTYVFCRDCGHTLACSACGTPLTFHSGRELLVCHHCGRTRRQPRQCPQCRGTRIRYFGAGTEKVEAEVQRLFGGARTVRWDRDTTQGKGAHDIILRRFRDHQADVLVGTQMIAKGLDLPLVTLVGVVSADVGLSLPDYRAPERVFQVLTQVAGRAGRSLLGGRVIVQSYQPDHYAIQAAAGHDFKGFYEKEAALRREYGYPPAGKLVRLLYRHHKLERVESEARAMAAIVQHRMEQAGARSTALVGPAPCFFDRIAGEYRWHLLLRGPNPAPLLADLPLQDWRVEVEPLSLL